MRSVGIGLVRDEGHDRAPSPPGAPGGEVTGPLARLTARRDHDGRLILAMAGEIDSSNVTALEAEIAVAVADAATVVADLSAVGYIDSQGLRLLVGLARRLVDEGRSLTVVAPPGSFAAHLLELTRMHELVPVVPALERPPGGAA